MIRATSGRRRRHLGPAPQIPDIAERSRWPSLLEFPLSHEPDAQKYAGRRDTAWSEQAEPDCRSRVDVVVGDSSAGVRELCEHVFV
jgi:hypothetical protein